MKAVNRGNLTFSFFFTNFPEDCEVKMLKARMSEIGEVADIFCPNRRDKAGKRFGFVRFWKIRISNVEATLERLNNVWIGSFN